jgi:putative flippase GtrA
MRRQAQTPSEPQGWPQGHLRASIDAQIMTAAAPLFVDRSPDPRVVDVEIVVPVYNEQRALPLSIHRLHRYLSERFPLRWSIMIVDNASVDRTWDVACRLTEVLPGVRAVHLDQKGRGLALRTAWGQSSAAVVAYMDVDLSTDLDALLPLVAPLLSGHSDVAIGSRLAHGADVVRGPKRELISRCYNLILRAAFRNGFSDAQCGFKAVRADIVRRLLPLIEDNGWFFDTELLVLAEYNGLRIHEVPVDWVDDPDSRVEVTSTALDDLRGVVRLLHRFAQGKGELRSPDGAGEPSPDSAGPRGVAGQLIHFAGVGVISTITFCILYALLYGPLGAVGADIVSLLSCSVANLAVNRRVTFGARGRHHRGRHYRAGLVLAAAPLLISVTALAGMGAAGANGLGIDLATLTVANLACAVTRFRLLRSWAFRPTDR